MPWQPIDQLAAAEQKLGAATAEFPYSQKHYLYRLAQCGGGILLGCFLIYLAIQMSRQGWAFPLLLILFALGAFVGSGYVIRRTLSWPHLRVKVFPAGLLSMERDRFIVLYWGQVESVWEKITIHTNQNPLLPGRVTHVFTVQLTGGEKVVFTDSLYDVATLGETIAEETTRRLLPRALKTCNEGGVVSFGNWSASRAGLQDGSTTLPWQTISQVDVVNGIVSVSQQGKFLASAREEASKIPNLSVLLALVDSLRGARKR